MMPPQGWTESFYCNYELGCKCYMPPCENVECEEKGGKCISPYQHDLLDDVHSYGNDWNWEPQFYCDEELDCMCYMPPITCINDACDAVGGKCLVPIDLPSTKISEFQNVQGFLGFPDNPGFPDFPENPEFPDLPQGWMPKFYCNQALNCMCYAPSTTTCENTQCELIGGKCILPDVTTTLGFPNNPENPEFPDLPQGWVPTFFCNQALNCMCYAPSTTGECKNSQCEIVGGKCILPNVLPPSDYESKFYCNEDLECKCYVPSNTTSTCSNEACSERKGICVMPDEVQKGSSR